MLTASSIGELRIQPRSKQRTTDRVSMRRPQLECGSSGRTPAVGTYGADRVLGEQEMKRAATLLTIAVTVTACSAVNVRELSREAADLANGPASEVVRVHGDPDFLYVEPSAPEIRYIGYLLSTGCSITYLVRDDSVKVAVTIGPGCHESPREPTRADWAISEIKGRHIGEILLTLFGTPDSSDLDTNGSGVLSYELGSESERQKSFASLSRPRFGAQESLPMPSAPRFCTVDIALANGIAIGGWTKGGGCKEREF